MIFFLLSTGNGEWEQTKGKSYWVCQVKGSAGNEVWYAAEWKRWTQPNNQVQNVPFLTWVCLLSMQIFLLTIFLWSVCPQFRPHLWLLARQWRNCSKPSPLPLALKLSWWTWKNEIFFWRDSWKIELKSAERWPPFAGSCKTSVLWPRVTSRRRHRATDSVSRAKQSWRASRPFCLYCICERWGRTWTQDHIVVLASVSHVCLVQCLTLKMLHHRCICWHFLLLLFQSPEGSLCIRPCLLPHADYSGTPHLLNLKPGTSENCKPSVLLFYMDSI